MLPHPATTYRGHLGHGGHPGTMTRVTVPMALYDLAHDPGETSDVQELYPEVVQKILGFAEAARQDLGDDLTQRPARNVRQPALLEEKK